MTFYFCNTFGNTSTDGIYRIDLGRNDSRETLAAPLKNLEWACIAPNGILYAVGQEESGGSYIQSFYLKQLTGELFFLEKSCFPWRGISHMSFWEQGKALLIAVYGEQMVVSVDVAEGRIGKESGRVLPHRQSQARRLQRRRAARTAGQRRAALLIFHRSRQVTLGDMGDFVRHN